MASLSRLVVLISSSWFLRQSGDGGHQDGAEEPAQHADEGKHRALEAGQPLATRIVEEIGELPVDLDDGQQAAEGRAEAPGCAPDPRRRHGIPEIDAAQAGDADHPVENAEGMVADSETRDLLEEQVDQPCAEVLL